MEKNYFYMVYHAILKAHVAQIIFFSNILIGLVLTGRYTKVPWQVVLPYCIFQRCCAASLLLVWFIPLSLLVL